MLTGFVDRLNTEFNHSVKLFLFITFFTQNFKCQIQIELQNQNFSTANNGRKKI